MTIHLFHLGELIYLPIDDYRCEEECSRFELTFFTVLVKYSAVIGGRFTCLAEFRLFATLDRYDLLLVG